MKKIIIRVRNRMKTVEELLTEDPERSVWSVILEQNRYDKNLLANVLDGEIPKKEFKDRASERLKGQWQWGMASYNIRLSKYLCKHACTYCYIGPMFKRWGRICETPDIEDMMPTDPKNVRKSWSQSSPSGRKLYFFPSSSDIFEENAVDYVSVCRKMIDAGHEIFFVTKPSMASIRAIVSELTPKYKSKMRVFVTITTDDDAILREFEPFAPLYKERVSVIQYLIEQNFSTNVMMEPYLSDPIPIIEGLMPILATQKDPDWVVAIGKMNYSKSMILNECEDRDVEMKTYLGELYSSSNLKRLWDRVKLDSHLYLKKDTVMSLLKLIK
jgi:hypothetical protein